MKAAFCFLLTALCSLPCADCLSAQAQAAPATEASKPVAQLDINCATAQEFETLPGVGPELARRIVAYREKHGPFRRVEDILVVRGIGGKKWKAIRPYLQVGSAQEKKRAMKDDR